MLEKEYALEIQKRVDTAAQLIREAGELARKHSGDSLAEMNCYDEDLRDDIVNRYVARVRQRGLANIFDGVLSMGNRETKQSLLAEKKRIEAALENVQTSLEQEFGATLIERLASVVSALYEANEIARELGYNYLADIEQVKLAVLGDALAEVGLTHAWSSSSQSC